MTKNYPLKLSIFLLILLFSCKSREKKELPTYTVTKTDFEDFLTIDGLVEPVQSTTFGCPRNSDGYITYIIEDGAYVKDSEVVCIIDDKDLKQRYDESLVNLETAKAELNKTKANLDLQYALMEAQVKNNAAETDIANLDSAQIKYLSPVQRKIKELELEIVSIEKHKLEKKLKSLAIINQSELKKTEFQIQRLTNDIKSSKEQLDGLVVRSTRSGMASRAMHYSGRKVQIGDNVWNGMAVVNIPDLTKMKVKIIASENDCKRIEENDAVEYSFDAMPKNKAWGKIVKKSPVGQPVKQNSKVKIFEIEASIDTAKMIPGPDLTTKCKVILKRIKDTIVIPQITIFEQDSMKVVYVKKSDKYEMRQIITGSSSQNRAVVVAGLHEKEKISFIKPGSDLIENKTLLTKSILKKFKNYK
ncbi:MAG: efflux RND transporter periplasmic adaptor subunit [Paludibacter sp.]